MSAENLPRLADTVNYQFLSPDGYPLKFVNMFLGEGDLPLYRFVYATMGVIHTLDIDEDLHIVLKDDMLQSEPYDLVTFSFPEIRLSLLLSTNSKEDFFRGTAQVHVSEWQEIGLLNPDNYQHAEQLFGDRLLGAVNLKVVRTTIGLASVDACVVNQGEIPEF